jgi:hypothetical protein
MVGTSWNRGYFGRRAAVLVAGCLVGSLSTAVTAVTAGAAVAEATPASCVDSQPDPARAALMARTCQRRVEVSSARSQAAQIFANADGSMTLTESLVPRWTRRADGSWAAVDTALRRATDGTVAPAAAVQRMVFSGDGSGPLARLVDGGRELAIWWPGALPVPTLQGDSAVYGSVLPDVDLRVTASATGFSEVLVVKNRRAAANPALRVVTFRVSAKGLTVVATPGGGMVARDGSGRAVFTAPAPLMWDSSGQAEPAVGGAAGPAAALSVGRREAVMPVRVSGDQLSIVPDQAMLADPAVRYPVFLDPSWSGGLWGGQFTSVTSKYPGWSFWQNGGWLDESSTKGGAGSGLVCDFSDSQGNCTSPTYVVRSLFRMDVSGVLGKQILGATFSIEQRWSWTCNVSSAINARLWLTSDVGSGTTWDNQPYWNGDFVADGTANHRVDGANGCAGVGRVEFLATRMVQNAVDRNSPVMTVGLRAISEGTTAQWKRFDFGTATISINYNTPPNVPDTLTVDAKGCVSGANRPFVSTATPTLRARVTDPDGDSLQAWYHYAKWDPARSAFVDVAEGRQDNVPNGGTAAFSISGLVDGGIYTWRAQTTDLHGGWSPVTNMPGNCEWQVDLTDPTPPTVSGDLYQAGSVGCPPEGCGGVGQTGSFTFSSSPDVTTYRWGFTDPPALLATPGTLGGSVTVQWPRSQVARSRCTSRRSTGPGEPRPAGTSSPWPGQRRRWPGGR